MLNYYEEYLPQNLYIPDSLCVCDRDTIGFRVPFVTGINLATLLNSSQVRFPFKILFKKNRINFRTITSYETVYAIDRFLFE